MPPSCTKLAVVELLALVYLGRLLLLDDDEEEVDLNYSKYVNRLFIVESKFVSTPDVALFFG